MQSENDHPSTLAPQAVYFQLLVGIAVVFLVGAAVFAVLVLEKLNRVVAVAENVDAKVDRAFAGAAPLGKAVVEKGVKTLEAVDTQDLGKAATEGVKDVGRVAKNKAIDWINQRAEKERIEKERTK